MTESHSLAYKKIEDAIEFIRSNFKQQPSLDEIAKNINLSPQYFQKLFTQWAGVSPKKFLQFLSLEYIKNLLKDNSTLFDAAFETGLSGTGRLHDLFINIEGMTPGEYKNGGESLTINYSFAESPFGNLIVASTLKGICYLAFAENDSDSINAIKNKFPNADYNQMVDLHQQNALFIFNQDWSNLNEIKLHLKGTPFQLKVWETLLKIPYGKLASYRSIANYINRPNAHRAVGTAIGCNPVAYLIPCHRVIQSSGVLGGYHWGTARKAAIIGWENSKNCLDV